MPEPHFFVLRCRHSRESFHGNWSRRLCCLNGHRARRDGRRQVLVEHSLQVHRERSESLRTTFRHRTEHSRPRVEETPEARFGPVVEARLAPFVDDIGQGAIGDETALERTQDEALGAFVRERQLLETADAIGFDLLELAERSDRLGDGFAESFLPEARVLAGDEQVGSERQVVALMQSSA